MGGQVYGEYITEYLRANGIHKELGVVVDDEYVGQNKNHMPLSEFIRNYAENAILIFGFYNYNIVKSKYKAYHGRIKYLYDFRIGHVGDRLLEWRKDCVEARLAEYEKTYDMLCDEKSRQIMQRYLRAAVNGEFEQLWEICYEPTAYFNKITEKLPIKVLVDCGAFNGDDIHDFVKLFHDYQKIYAIEPDAENIEQLQKRIAEEAIRNITVIPKGVYCETTVLSFVSNQGVASHMDENGDIKIPVISIDETIKESDENIFIKMDIEGSEMDALKGAANTIAKKHPCLAICVYHKEDDLITIPQYIDSLVEPGTYNYYLGFHGYGLAELVFYAVPKYMEK